jgi:hypothetical protein
MAPPVVWAAAAVASSSNGARNNGFIGISSGQVGLDLTLAG